jgi:MFS family permease
MSNEKSCAIVVGGIGGLRVSGGAGRAERSMTNYSGDEMTTREATATAELKRNWPALIAAAWGCCVGLTGLMFYSFSTFVPLFESREGWSRGQISIALPATALGFLFAAPFAGRLIDRYGVRRVLLISIPMLAFGLLLPSIASRAPWTLWMCYLLLSVIGIGASPIAYARLITARFNRARGLALGITLAGTGVSAIALPPIMTALTQTYGITGGYVGLAVLALTPWLYVALFVREIPMSTPAPSSASEATKPLSAPRGASTGNTWRFAVIAASFFVVSLGLVGVVVHLVAMMRDAGLDAARAAIVASGVGVGVIAARVLIGWILDHVYAPMVAVVVFVAAAIGCLLLAHGGTGQAVLAAGLIGVAIGGEIDIIAYLVSRYFPPGRFGSIYGWQYGLFTVGAGLSPVLINALRTPDGAYTTSLTIAAIAAVVGGLPLLALGRYRS